MEENFGYFLAAYLVVLAALFAYIFRLYMIQRKLRQELDSLKDEVKNRASR